MKNKTIAVDLEKMFSRSGYRIDPDMSRKHIV